MADERGVARTFAMLVADVEDGQLNGDMTDVVQDLIAKMNDAAMSKSGKAKGKLVVTLNFELDGGIFTITSDHKVTVPKMARMKSVFWCTPENNLSRRNPSQHELELRDVSAPNRDVRHV